jgi:beta-galactosidase
MVEGPGRLIGESLFSLTGGVGAFWIRADTTPGEVTVRAKHPRLGTKTVKLQLQAAPAERA